MVLTAPEVVPKKKIRGRVLQYDKSCCPLVNSFKIFIHTTFSPHTITLSILRLSHMTYVLALFPTKTKHP